MNDIDFSKSFNFLTIEFDTFHHTDNRSGAPSHYFAYMISGKAKITTQSQTVEINSGDIFYIPNTCAYQSYWYGEPTVKFVSLGFLCMPNFENKQYDVQVLPQNDTVARMFFELADTKQLTAYDIGVFYTLLGLLMPTMSNKKLSRSDELVELAKEYIINNPSISNPELAEQCMVSEATLYQAFKKSADITPNTMKNSILLEKARDILISGDKPIEYISDLLGYSSASYFRKKFKEYFGISPRKMRNQNRI